MSKDHFYFSRNDRIVALVLISVIIVSIMLRRPCNVSPSDYVADADTVSVGLSDESELPDSNRTERYRSVYSGPATIRKRTAAPTKRDSVKEKTVSKDSMRTVMRYPVKTRPVSRLDINGADSLQLVSLPGIGPYYASRIMRYREQLGGYVSVSQLSEIDGLPDSLMEWFIIADTVPVRKVQVNSATLTELRKHPYIDFYQARAIVEFRRERGKIKGPDQLSFMEEFTEQDLKRLEPYLDFRQD